MYIATQVLAPKREGYGKMETNTLEWERWNKELEPIIQQRARVFVRYGGHDYDLDDAMQQARLFLLDAMVGYDPDKGDRARYVSRVLSNSFRTLFHKDNTSAAKPTTHVAVAKEGGGTDWVKVKRSVVPLSTIENHDDWLLKGCATSPEESIQLRESLALAAEYDAAVYDELNEIDRKVYRLFIETEGDGEGGEYERFNHFIEWLQAEKYRKIQEIADQLGQTRNVINWCFYRIRTTATRIARWRRFSDLFGSTVRSIRWPRIWMSSKPKRDLQFVADTIREHGLDDEPLKSMHLEPDFFQESKNGSRRIERYSWGVVLTLNWGDDWRTFVIAAERFNPLSGDVFGTIGTRMLVPVDWYRNLVKDLKENPKVDVGFNEKEKAALLNGNSRFAACNYKNRTGCSLKEAWAVVKQWLN